MRVTNKQIQAQLDRLNGLTVGHSYEVHNLSIETLGPSGKIERTLYKGDNRKDVYYTLSNMADALHNQRYYSARED